MNSIAATPKMFSIIYYVLPMRYGYSNTYHFTQIAYSEDEAMRLFLNSHPINYLIQSISEIKRK